jgi:hypothetical protein
VASDRAGSEPGPDAEVADAAIVDELIASGARVGELIETLTADTADAAVRDQVEELLQSFDVLHREAMVRLAGLLAKQHLLEQVIEDPVLNFMFDLYELTPEQLKQAAKQQEAVNSGGLIKLGDIRHFPAAPAPPAPPSTPKAGEPPSADPQKPDSA